MKYLDSIEMFNYALDVLKAEQRVQVPVSKMTELLMIILNIQKKIGEEMGSQYQSTHMDLLQAIGVVQEMKNVRYLSDNMKSTLVNGVTELKAMVAKTAYNYYMTTEFEPTEEVIPIMRDVVRTYVIEGGAI